MKKKLLSFLVALCIMAMTGVSAGAVGTTDDTVQREVNETMAKVMEYLNENQKISLDCREVQEYEVPIGNGEYVTVAVKNEQVPDTRAGGASGLDRNYYDVVAGQSYNYTLTISDFYLFSGEMVYKVNYTVGTKLSDLVFPIRVNSVKLTATAPIGFSLSSIETLDRSNGDSRIIVETAGYALFKGPLGGDLGMIVEVTFGGHVFDGDYQLVVDYIYNDIDDV